MKKYELTGTEKYIINDIQKQAIVTAKEGTI